MSNYKDTYELYQSTFDEVHASDELIQRIKNMDTKHIKKKRIKHNLILLNHSLSKANGLPVS